MKINQSDFDFLSGVDEVKNVLKVFGSIGIDALVFAGNIYFRQIIYIIQFREKNRYARRLTD